VPYVTDVPVRRGEMVAFLPLLEKRAIDVPPVTSPASATAPRREDAVFLF
jgi:hypothetical protein